MSVEAQMDNKVQVPVTETERNSKMKISSSMRPVVFVAGLGGLFTVVNLAFAQTWTPTGAPTQAWTFVAGQAT